MEGQRKKFQVDYVPNKDMDSDEFKSNTDGVGCMPALGTLDAASAWHRESEQKQSEKDVGRLKSIGLWDGSRVRKASLRG